jgi:hypothetical protein
LPGIFDYPFDSLTGIGRLRSDDNRFRVFTWNVPLSDGSSGYFGYILMKESNRQGKRLYSLTDCSADPAISADQVLENGKWYGALYYKIIQTGDSKQTHYTLLGWNGNKPATNLKLIEALSFSPDGMPVFGAPLFKTPEGIRNRYFMEYAKNISVVLKWDEQTLRIPKGNKGRFSEEKSWMIVMDHLIPIDSQLAGHRKYYVPSGETYDAFIFRNNNWLYVDNVKVANPASPLLTPKFKPLLTD